MIFVRQMEHLCMSHKCRRVKNAKKKLQADSKVRHKNLLNTDIIRTERLKIYTKGFHLENSTTPQIMRTTNFILSKTMLRIYIHT